MVGEGLNLRLVVPNGTGMRGCRMGLDDAAVTAGQLPLLRMPSKCILQAENSNEAHELSSGSKVSLVEVKSASASLFMLLFGVQISITMLAPPKTSY